MRSKRTRSTTLLRQLQQDTRLCLRVWHWCHDIWHSSAWRTERDFRQNRSVIGRSLLASSKVSLRTEQMHKWTDRRATKPQRRKLVQSNMNQVSDFKTNVSILFLAQFPDNSSVVFWPVWGSKKSNIYINIQSSPNLPHIFSLTKKKFSFHTSQICKNEPLHKNDNVTNVNIFVSTIWNMEEIDAVAGYNCLTYKILLEKSRKAL